MRQQTFAEGGFEVHTKTTRRAAFLAEMERVVPWAELCAVIEPFYPKEEGNGHGWSSFIYSRWHLCHRC